MKRRAMCWAALAASSLMLVLLTTHGRAQGMRKVPLFFHVATSQGQPVAADAFIARQLSHANSIYASLGIELVAAGHGSLPERHAALLSRSDRDALVRYLRPGLVNCMVVASLLDVDEPGRERRGVHWRPRTHPSRHFVVVSAISGPYVLAHELGHFFGNREHSETPGNLMSYQLTEQVPFFSPVQVARVRTTLERMFTQRELSLRPEPRTTRKDSAVTSGLQ